MLILINCYLLTDDIWRDIKEEYGDLLPLIDTADTELEMWQHST